MTIGAETLVGTYRLVEIKMPDGATMERIAQQVRLPDGKVVWELVDDKVQALDARFQGTDTVPSPWSPPTTETVTKKDGTGNQTRDHVEAHLVEALGTPTRVLAAGKLDDAKVAHLKRNLSEASTLRRLCLIVGGKWSEVAPLIPR